MNKRCYIAGAGEFCENRLPAYGDYIIAADAGYAVLSQYGIIPDLIVGDFDSLDKYPQLLKTLSGHPNVIQSPVEKDDTDMMLAVRKGLELGFKSFIINGGLGGRLDQTYANIQILAYIAENDASGILYGQEMNVTAVRNSKIELFPDKLQTGIISVFCHGDKAEGVTIKGLKYPLKDAALNCTYPIGISNEILGNNAVISVREGVLIIIYPADIRIEH